VCRLQPAASGTLPLHNTTAAAALTWLSRAALYTMRSIVLVSAAW
jgi:hypothetical protein